MMTDAQLELPTEKPRTIEATGAELFKAIKRVADLPVAVRAADSFISQGKHMVCYGLKLKRRLHSFMA